MPKYPSDSECVKILRETGCSKRVIIHCCTVKAVAECMAERIDCDRDLVIAGALLHDVGRSVEHSIMHATIGAHIAEERGLPREIVEIIRKHTGAGLDDEDVKEMGLPPGDYMPSTIEEKIVAHSDNMVSDDEVIMHAHSVDKLVMKGALRGADRIERLHNELSELYGEDLDSIVLELGRHPVLKGPCGKIIK